MQEKGEKQTLTNAAGSSLETNAPVRVGMSDHNLRIAINQRNKGCRNNEMDETFLNHASAPHSWNNNLFWNGELLVNVINATKSLSLGKSAKNKNKIATPQREYL